MRAALGLAGLAARGHQALGCVGIGGLGPHQGGARLFGNQLLGAQLLFQVLDLLGARQQAGLFGVLGKEAQAVRRYSMARGHIDGLARLQLRAAVQRLVQRLRRKAAMQPVHQHGTQAAVVHAQQVGQARLRGGGLGLRCGGGAVEGQTRGRGISAAGTQKAAHHVQPPHGQGRQALAQRGFQGVLPAGLDVDAAPQTLQAIQPMPGQPGLQLAIDLQLFLQRLESLQACRQVGLARGLVVHGLLALAPLFVKLGHAVLQLLLARGGQFGALLGLL